LSYKKIIGLVFFLCGVALIVISFYIKNEVSEGKMKISRAEKQVEGGKKLFSLNPVTEEVGKGVFSSAEKKIGKGKRDVAYYESLSNSLLIIGIVLIIFGILVFFIGGKKRNPN
jgi:hypothetical protein